MKKIGQIILASCIALFNFQIASAQSLLPIKWEKSLGGSTDDRAYAVQQMDSGRIVLAGYSSSNNGDVTGSHGGKDFWVVEIDSQQNILWQKCLGGSGSDIANAIVPSNDGGVIVAGTTTSNDGDVTGNHGGYDYWIVKLNGEGNLVWQKNYGGSDDEEASCIAATYDGGYIVAGYTLSFNGDVTGNHGYRDMWVIKVDSAGNLEWQKCFGGTDWDDAFTIQQTSDSGYIVAGSSQSNNGDATENKGVRDYWIVKLDADANILWQKSYGGISYEVAWSIQQITGGGYIVAGGTMSWDGDVLENHAYFTDDYWILRLDNGGNIVWQNSLVGSDYDDPFAVHQYIEVGVFT